MRPEEIDVPMSAGEGIPKEWDFMQPGMPGSQKHHVPLHEPAPSQISDADPHVAHHELEAPPFAEAPIQQLDPRTEPEPQIVPPISKAEFESLPVVESEGFLSKPIEPLHPIDPYQPDLYPSLPKMFDNGGILPVNANTNIDIMSLHGFCVNLSSIRPQTLEGSLHYGPNEIGFLEDFCGWFGGIIGGEQGEEKGKAIGTSIEDAISDVHDAHKKVKEKAEELAKKGHTCCGPILFPYIPYYYDPITNTEYSMIVMQWVNVEVAFFNNGAEVKRKKFGMYEDTGDGADYFYDHSQSNSDLYLFGDSPYISESAFSNIGFLCDRIEVQFFFYTEYWYEVLSDDAPLDATYKFVSGEFWKVLWTCNVRK
ncbi:MAG: hypothetical protein U5N86_05150 [Planctomycetota bacterium]|nr:hypothetical protein [Planctomycetota bacterium]